MSSIPIKKLFLLVLIVKVLTSLLTLFLSKGQLDLVFWIFAFILPLFALCLYVIYGIKRADAEIGREKFADSCYYLGFLITIFAIVFSLIDLPNIGDNLYQIAVRFGVAMISTAFGLSVRVYLINFRKEVDDAIIEAEDSLIRGAEKFKSSIESATNSFEILEQKVTSSTEGIIAHMNDRIDKLSIDYSNRLNEQFLLCEQKISESSILINTSISDNNQRINDSILRLKTTVDEISEALKVDVQSFSNSLLGKLNDFTIPDDFFKERLSPAIGNLVSEIENLQASLSSIAQKNIESMDNLTSSLSLLNKRSNIGVKALDKIESFSSDLGDVSLSLTNASDRIGEISNIFSTPDFQNKVAKISSSISDIYLTMKSLESGIVEISQSFKSTPQLPPDFNSKLNDIASSVNSSSGLINEISILLKNRLVLDISPSDIVSDKDKNT